VHVFGQQCGVRKREGSGRESRGAQVFRKGVLEFCPVRLIDERGEIPGDCNEIYGLAHLCNLLQCIKCSVVIPDVQLGTGNFDERVGRSVQQIFLFGGSGQIRMPIVVGMRSAQLRLEVLELFYCRAG
jgi:hypothetical protein